MNHLNRFLKVFLTLVMLALPLATPLTTVAASEVELGQSDEHYEDFDATDLDTDWWLYEEVELELDEVEETEVEAYSFAYEEEASELLPLNVTTTSQIGYGAMITGGAFRAGPGTAHASMRTLTQGTELEILGSNADGRWLNVRIGNQVGFAFADSVRQTTRFGVMVAGGAFRVGPGTAHASMRTLTQGTELEVLGVTADGRWLNVRIGNQVGFAFADSVRQTTRVGVMIAGGAFRVGPGTAHASMRTLTQGTELEILGTSADGRWLRVRSGNQVGFAFADSVRQTTRFGVMTAGGAFRIGPGTAHASMRTLTQGTELEILGTNADGRWLRVRSGNQVGFAFADSVSQTTRFGIMTAGGAFRVGPGTGHVSMRTLTRGAQVGILGSSVDGRWLRVRNGNQVGWVFADSVGAHRGPYAASAVSGVTYGAVQLRSGAGTNHAVIRTVPNHSTLALLNRSGSWIRVRYRQLQANGHTQVSHYGWMHEDSVRIAPTNSFMVTTHGGRVNTSADLRSGAGANHSLIRTLNNGTNVTVLRQSGTWLNVRVGSDEGWVREDFINSTTQATTTIRTTFRSGPGTAYNEIGRIPAGINGTIIHHQGLWVYMMFEGQTGWVLLTHLHIRPVRELANASNTISSTTRHINITGETGLRVVVPERRTIAAGRAFDGWQNVQVQHVAANGNVTNLALNRSWQATFTHNGTTFNLQWEGMLDNLIPGTYVRQLVVRRGNTVVGRGQQTVVTR